MIFHIDIGEILYMNIYIYMTKIESLNPIHALSMYNSLNIYLHQK